LNGYLPSRPGASLAAAKIDNVVDDIVKLLEYAKGFPQEHLMSAGQLSLNRHITHNPGIEPSLGGLSANRKQSGLVAVSP